jgi:hypothetical protein
VPASRLDVVPGNAAYIRFQFVLAGGSIEKLSKLMGHSSVTTTERNAHLRADLFRVEDYDRLIVDMSARDGDVATLKAPADTVSSALSYAGATHGKRGRVPKS